MCSWMREKETCLSLLELAFRNISKSWSRLEGENEGHEKRKRSLSIFIMFTFQFCLISGGCKAIPFPFTYPSSSSNRLSKFIERQQIPKNYLVVDRGGGALYSRGCSSGQSRAAVRAETRLLRAARCGPISDPRGVSKVQENLT